MRRARVIILIVVLTVAFLMAGIATRAAEKESWISYIETVCEEYNICPELIEAMIEKESSWNPNAENGGCIGLMQISEKWHKDRMKRLGVTDLYDPYDNILVGVDYLAELFEEYEDVGMVLLVYSGSRLAKTYWETGEISSYVEWVLDRSAELERAHGK